MNSGKSIAVVLFQLGGPDSLEAIEPFLLRLFRDPDIIDFPFAKIAREPLARVISATRAKKVRNHYAEIGGKSPILEFTQRQARALEVELRQFVEARVFVAMRYWHPLTEEAVRDVEAFAPRELVLLPLYPQYSRTTTGSSLNEWTRQIASSPLKELPTRVIREFYSDAAYLDSLAASIHRTLSKFPDSEEVHIVFSAHSVPVSVIEKGDPYQMQIESTVERVLELGRWHHPHTLCYQSKVGASKWLQPSLALDLENAGRTSHSQRAGGAGGVCIGPRRNSQRDQHRSARGSCPSRHRPVRADARAQRRSELHPGARRIGSGRTGAGGREDCGND